MTISYQKHGDRIYGTVCTVFRDEKGIVRKSYKGNLGRLLDKDRLIFMNRTDGVFQYDPKTQKKIKVTEEIALPKRKRRIKIVERPVNFRFADVYLLDSYMKSIGFYKMFQGAFDDKSEMLKAMICFYLLSSLSNSSADIWYEGSFAKFLFPNLNLSSQRVSDFLGYIGEPSRQQAFFQNYLRWFSERFNKEDLGNILIDSTGLPNDIHFNLTAISNHNGQISNEVRLVYVVQQSTTLPIFFRCVPGNVIDVSTIKRTLLLLKQYGVDVHYSITDAGYYSEDNIREFYKQGISFLLRLQPNLRLYKQIVKEHLADIVKTGILVKQNKRLVRVKKIACKLCQRQDRKGNLVSPGFDAYAYLCVDEQRQAFEKLRQIDNVIEGKSKMKTFDENCQSNGVFVLISKRSVRPESVIELYYTRQQIEQVFDFGKNYASMLPLSTQKEQTFMGHMLLTFLATIIVKLLSKSVSDSNLPSVKTLLEALKNNTCTIHGDLAITAEPSKLCNAVYKATHTEFPVSVCIN